MQASSRSQSTMMAAFSSRFLLLLYAFTTIISLVECGDNIWGVNLPSHRQALRDALDNAERDLDALSARTTPIPMQYSIFQGASAVRSIPECDEHLINLKALFGVTTSTSATAAQYRACAILLLLRGLTDAAHDVILGVTPHNFEEAEYAATHRGETNWTQEHPLSDSADMIHAVLHRLEGSLKGEGGYKGYENSKYWLAGGPKALESPAKLSVRTVLARIAQDSAPYCVADGVVACEEGAKHSIIADGGNTRTVCVAAGEWDGFIFADLCERREYGELSKEQADEVTMLQREELMLSLRSELDECEIGNDSNFK